jgi:hypothetical protein
LEPEQRRWGRCRDRGVQTKDLERKGSRARTEGTSVQEWREWKNVEKGRVVITLVFSCGEGTRWNQALKLGELLGCFCIPTNHGVTMSQRGK